MTQALNRYGIWFARGAYDCDLLLTDIDWDELKTDVQIISDHAGSHRCVLSLRLVHIRAGDSPPALGWSDQNGGMPIFCTRKGMPIIFRPEQLNQSGNIDLHYHVHHTYHFVFEPMVHLEDFEPGGRLGLNPVQIGFGSTYKMCASFPVLDTNSFAMPWFEMDVHFGGIHPGIKLTDEFKAKIVVERRP